MPVPQGNADLVQGLVRDKLDAALPDDWLVYARRDFIILPADEFPACYAVNLPEVILEEETDNQVLVGYRIGVGMLTKLAAITAEFEPLDTLRRTAQQAVHSTSYTGLVVEQVLLTDALDLPLPDVQDGYLSTGFIVTIGLLELREV